MKNFHLGELRGCHIIHYFAMAWEGGWIFRDFQLNTTDSEPLAILIIEDIISILFLYYIFLYNFISEYFNVSSTGVDPFKIFFFNF